MAFDMAKLVASIFGRLELGRPEFIRGGAVNAAMGGCGEGVANT